MAELILELTDRCDLACRHCFSSRHGGARDLPLATLEIVLANAADHGLNRLGLTGGEPTLHPRFGEIVARIAEAGYRYGLVSNGQRLGQALPQLLPYRQQLTALTFSLDGATAETHDRLRGAGAFLGVMRAISLCRVHDLPFTLNCALTTLNRLEVAQLANLAQGLGARGLRFGFLMHNRATARHGLALAPQVCRDLADQIRALAQQHAMPIGLATGHHTTESLPCEPLRGQSYNIDVDGNLSACCHLAGYRQGGAPPDLGGNLTEMTFSDALGRTRQAMDDLRRARTQRLASDAWRDTDYFPCWTCCQHYGLLDWLYQQPDHPWYPALWPRAEKQAQEVG